MKQLFASAILGLLIVLPVVVSAETYNIGKTRTHSCTSRWICGEAKEVEVSRIYFPGGKSGTLRIYKDKNGDVVRIVIDK